MKKILFIVSIISLFVFSSCTNITKEHIENKDINKIKEQNIEDTNKISNQNIEDTNMIKKYNKIVENKEWDKCKELKDPFVNMCLNEFYYTKAIEKKDKSLCEKITSKDYKIFCISNIGNITNINNIINQKNNMIKKYNKIVENKEWDKCKELKDPFISMCFNDLYYAKAIEKKDKTLCEKITDNEYEKSCIEYINKLGG